MTLIYGQENIGICDILHRKTFRPASTATERNIQTAEDIGHIV